MRDEGLAFWFRELQKCYISKKETKGGNAVIGILNEKPSQARNFAKALGGYNGKFNGEDYIIVAARGHLYGFVDDPSKQVSGDLEETYKSWNVENLPWNEKDFLWRYQVKEGANATLQDVHRTLAKCNEIVIATDDDPTGEGELLAWEILSQEKIEANTYSRMFFSDESEKEIQKAFLNRKILGHDLNCMYEDPDYRQALFRTKWDYLSMQWTRIASAFSPYGQVPRQGRLKSAMVKIVGDQLDALDKYVKKPYYQVRFKDENGVIYTSEDEIKHQTKEDAPVGNFTKSNVVYSSVEIKHQAPPKFLDLATLSGILAPKGIDAKTVLATYQKMYEAKIVSYPRTEDKCITIEQYKQLLPYVDKIAKLIEIDASLLTHKEPRKTHIKDGMAHGANRPGTVVPSSLDSLDREYGNGARLIYETLARNYLATLYEDYEYEQQKGYIEKYPKFTATVNNTKKLGWKAIYDEENEDTEELKLGSMAGPFVFEGVNSKPAVPTMKWLMKQLEKYDVGTGATRTSIYADITNAKSAFPLLKESRGRLSMAPNGISSYHLLPNTLIGSLDLTEKVMNQMKAVYKGENDGEEFLHDIQSMICHDIDVMKENGKGLNEIIQREKSAQLLNSMVGICPLCGGQVVERDNFYGCSNYKSKGCHFGINKIISSKRITKTIAKQLLEKGETGLISGFKSKLGKEFSAHLKLSEDGKIEFRFPTVEEKGLGKCPICSKGDILETSKSYSCSEWKNGCKATIWKNSLELRGKNKISANEAKKLFAGETIRVKLKRKSDGKPYDANVSFNRETCKLETELAYKKRS